MINLEYFGEAKQHQKIVPGNTATGLDADCYEYKEWTFTFNSGGTGVPAVGNWLVGATTTTARCRIVSIGTLTSGSWAGGNAAGEIRVCSAQGDLNGSENLALGATADDMTMTSLLKEIQYEYPYKGMLAKIALIQCYANTALCAWDGSIPDQTSLVGQPLSAGSSLVLRDLNDIKKFKCIDYTAGSASIIQVTFYF